MCFKEHFIKFQFQKQNVKKFHHKNVQLTLGSIPLEAISPFSVVAWFLELKKPDQNAVKRKCHVFVELSNYLLNTLVG